MGRLKGTKKTGGRKAGTPNKVTGTLKEFIVALIDDNREQIIKDIATLDAKDRVFFLERLMAYVIPKLASTKFEQETKDDLVNITIIPGPGREIARSEDEIED